jgi:type III pantothenate kinase
MQQQEDEEINIIATGGMAEMIAPYCSSITIIDPLLTLTGLRLIHELSYALNADRPTPYP